MGMKRVSDAVALTLKAMKDYARPGMSTLELDQFGEAYLAQFGARSAPKLTYGFPGCTCISIRGEFCHGIPSASKILEEGDLINIDVSAELDNFWSDNGASFVLGEDIHGFQGLVETSASILTEAVASIKSGVRISGIGSLIEERARSKGFKVIKNLGGHGIGRGLHEEPNDLLNYRVPSDRRSFSRNTVVAIETFISTRSTLAKYGDDGWTMTGNRGGFMAQHEHTIVVTDDHPIILTEKNGIGFS